MIDNTEGLFVNKPALVTDGYDGGLRIERNASATQGGTRGNVNCGLYSHTISGKNSKQFEWTTLSVLDNYADEGENVALYAQANKHGTGPTWGACIEACDTTPGDASALVGLEVDCWAAGPDNGLRLGIDIVLGDAQSSRGGVPGAAVGGTAGIRIGPSSKDPQAKWSTGIKLNGPMDNCIDCSDSGATQALKLGWHQTIKVGGINLVLLTYCAFLMGAASLALQFSN